MNISYAPFDPMAQEIMANVHSRAYPELKQGRTRYLVDSWSFNGETVSVEWIDRKEHLKRCRIPASMLLRMGPVLSSKVLFRRVVWRLNHLFV